MHMRMQAQPIDRTGDADGVDYTNTAHLDGAGIGHGRFVQLAVAGSIALFADVAEFRQHFRRISDGVARQLFQRRVQVALHRRVVLKG